MWWLKEFFLSQSSTWGAYYISKSLSLWYIYHKKKMTKEKERTREEKMKYCTVFFARKKTKIVSSWFVLPSNVSVTLSFSVATPFLSTYQACWVLNLNDYSLLVPQKLIWQFLFVLKESNCLICFSSEENELRNIWR